MSQSVRNFAIRAGMIFGALVFLTHPFILRLGGVVQSLAGRVGFDPYPMQGEMLLIVLLSLLGAAIWRAVDKNGWDNETLWKLLLVETRFVLAAAMLLSGLEKVLHVQMPWPTAPDWIRPLREMPSLYYVKIWTGASGLHETMLGLTELAAGVCLLFLRTTTLGALIALISVGNNVMIVLGFDDPRVGSYWPFVQLAAMALLLALMDLKRVWEFFAFEDKPTTPTDARHHWASPTLQRLERTAKTAFVIVVLLASVPIVVRGLDARARSPLAGAYAVEDFSVNGQAVTTAAPDAARSRWRLVGIDDCRRFAIRTIDDRQLESTIVGPSVGRLRQHSECASMTSAETGTLTIAPADVRTLGLVRPGPQGELRYARRGATVQLEGKIDDATVVVRLRRIPDKDFNVNKYPNSF
jgi:hypothetical protein